MGIRGLQTFMDETCHKFRKVQLHDCNIVLDGDSISYQMYTLSNLTVIYGGEYEEFYECCTELFKSFEKCKIK